MVHAQQILGSMKKAWSQLMAPRIDAGVVRLGVTEEIVTSWLPPMLLQFGQVHPQVRLGLTVGITRELVFQLDQDELDLVLGKRRVREDRGEGLGMDRLVWVGLPEACHFEGGHPVRLAVFPPSCIYRACMVEALQAAGLSWEMGCTSPSLAGILAAVKAGLGVTALPEAFVDDVRMRISPACGLPALPMIEFAMFGGTHDASPAVQALRRLLVQDAEVRNLCGQSSAVWLLPMPSGAA